MIKATDHTGADIVPINPDAVIPQEFRGTPPLGVSGEVTRLVSTPSYDAETILRLEGELLTLNINQPATRSPDISTVLDIIEDITGGTSLSEIYSYLDNTQANSPRSRADLQRCGALLHKIAGFGNDADLNWGLIFSRLNLDSKKAA